jgi:signal transduction histidine kinase
MLAMLRRRQHCGVNIENSSQPDETRREAERAARLAVAGELVAAVTHDLRQPLTAIEMNVAAAVRFLERAANTQLSAEGHSRIAEAIAALRDALGEQHRMREALQVLQDLTARRDPTFRPLDLVETVREVVRLMASDAVAHHVDIELAHDDQVPRVLADVVLVRQALLNILIETFESTSQLGHDKPRILVDVRSHDADTVDITVQYTATPTSPRPSDRWGLAIARSVVEAHGAALMVRDSDTGIWVITRWPLRNMTTSRAQALAGDAGEAYEDR